MSDGCCLYFDCSTCPNATPETGACAPTPTVSPEERFSVVHVGESRTAEDAERDLNRCLAHLHHARHLARQILSSLDGLGGGVTRKSMADLRRWAELVERDGER